MALTENPPEWLDEFHKDITVIFPVLNDKMFDVKVAGTFQQGHAH